MEDQVLTMQDYNDTLASEFTKIKFDTKTNKFESTETTSDMNEIKTMLTHTMSQKNHSSQYTMD